MEEKKLCRMQQLRICMHVVGPMAVLQALPEFGSLLSAWRFAEAHGGFTSTTRIRLFAECLALCRVLFIGHLNKAVFSEGRTR
jgi:hypothetical protein